MVALPACLPFLPACVFTAPPGLLQLAPPTRTCVVGRHVDDTRLTGAAEERRQPHLPAAQARGISVCPKAARDGRLVVGMMVCLP